jgi:hypothetical protein
MTRDELIERSIVALCNAERKIIGLPQDISRSDQLLLNDRDFIEPQVRAVLSEVLAALLEPTAEMRIAGAHVHDQRPSEVAAVFAAMLNASPLALESESR